jgi:hypothetical protein
MAAKEKSKEFHCTPEDFSRVGSLIQKYRKELGFSVPLPNSSVNAAFLSPNKLLSPKMSILAPKAVDTLSDFKSTTYDVDSFPRQQIFGEPLS